MVPLCEPTEALLFTVAMNCPLFVPLVLITLSQSLGQLVTFHVSVPPEPQLLTTKLFDGVAPGVIVPKLCDSGLTHSLGVPRTVTDTGISFEPPLELT